MQKHLNFNGQRFFGWEFPVDWRFSVTAAARRIGKGTLRSKRGRDAGN